ncbi:Na+/H+ antiporter subunit E [bacterium]|nr:Na+/H+ antiporter subunit E [bacterium]
MLFKRFLSSLIVGSLFWALLSWPLDLQKAVVGAVVVLIISAIFVGSRQCFSDFRYTPAAFGHAFIYIFVFLWALIKSNLDVARRVVSPSLPINPGIVVVKTKLKTKLGRFMLANSITLTPGTLTVDTDGDTFYIHWIDVASTDIDKATQDIVSNFEKHLEAMYG